MRLKITLILIISPLFILKGQPRYDLADIECFRAVMITGFQNGFWDISKIDSTSSGCIDFYNDHIFNVVVDTLQVVHIADTNLEKQKFFGFKAYICSDSLIKADLYIHAELKGKAAKRAKKENSSTTIESLGFELKKSGDSYIIGFRKPD